jgi:hypothetical protein
MYREDIILFINDLSLHLYHLYLRLLIYLDHVYDSPTVYTFQIVLFKNPMVFFSFFAP